MSDLNNITVSGLTVLYSYNGGTPGYDGISAADFISAKTGGSPAYVSRLVNVNYFRATGIPYGVPDWGKMKSFWDFITSGWAFVLNDELYK